MSIPEIQAVTGASKGILSLWLKPYPLTVEELRKRKQLNQISTIVASSKTRALEREKEGIRTGLVVRYGCSTRTSALEPLAKGKIAESAISLRLAVHGYSVFRSIFDGDRVDLVVGADGTRKYARLQVKWAGCSPTSKGRPVIPLYRRLGCRSALRRKVRYVDLDFDFIIGYDFERDLAYVFASADVATNDFVAAVGAKYEERWDKLHAFLFPNAITTEAA